MSRTPASGNPATKRGSHEVRCMQIGRNARGPYHGHAGTRGRCARGAQGSGASLRELRRSLCQRRSHQDAVAVRSRSPARRRRGRYSRVRCLPGLAAAFRFCTGRSFAVCASRFLAGKVGSRVPLALVEAAFRSGPLPAFVVADLQVGSFSCSQGAPSLRVWCRQGWVLGFPLFSPFFFVIPLARRSFSGGGPLLFPPLSSLSLLFSAGGAPDVSPARQGWETKTKQTLPNLSLFPPSPSTVIPRLAIGDAISVASEIPTPVGRDPSVSLRALGPPFITAQLLSEVVSCRRAPHTAENASPTL